MPPEPLSSDRKEVGFKDRKHERGPGCDALGGGGGSSSSSVTTRWREPYQGSRGDFHRASPRRPPPGQHRQGSAYYQVFPEEAGGGHGCTPSRSGEEDSFARQEVGRIGVSRDSRGSFRRSPHWDSGELSQQLHEFPAHATGLRSIAIPVSPVSHASSQPPLKDQCDKSSGGVEDGSGTGRSYDRDQSLGSISWKPRKWTRPCNLSSSKATKTESDETGVEVMVPAGKETPVRSPVMSPLLSDDGAPRKKPRLSWGQGLAKYEKKKVEGSSDTVEQSGSVQGASTPKASLDDMSPKLTSVSGWSSPATQCSAISSTSPACVEGNLCTRESNNNASHPGDSSGQGLEDCSEEFSIKVDPLEVNAISNLTSLLADLLQHEDAHSGDSSFTRHTTMSKLLVFKGDISKELEKTECEIDSLENELKTLNGDGKNDPCHISFSSPVTCSPDPCLGSAVALEMPPNPIPAKNNVLPSPRTLVGESLQSPESLEEHDVEVKCANDYSLGTVSLKCSKPVSSAEGISVFGPQKMTGCTPNDEESLNTLGGHGVENSLDVDRTNVYTDHVRSPNVKLDDSLVDLILASNRDAAKKASQVFDEPLSIDAPLFGIWGPDHFSSCRRNEAHVREKIALHKHQSKLKERVLGLKFRALYHLWKEDMRLLSLRTNRPKSQKRLELCIRSSQSGSQRHRSSIRSRFTLPAGNLTLLPTTEILDFTSKSLSDSQAKLYRKNLNMPALILDEMDTGNLTLVPTSEIIDFTSKLLSDSQIKLYRKNLNMPALILDEMDSKYSRFISHNGLVEDPGTFEKEKGMINPWTQEEKQVFMDKLAAYGKDFTKISSFLSHKTTADCVEFYYKNHKSDCFKDVKKQLDLRKQPQCSRSTNKYMLTAGTKWNREVNAAQLHMSGEELAVAHIISSTRNQQKHVGRSLERASSADDISRHEREIVAADVLAGICAEAMSSSVISSIDPAEKVNYATMDTLTPEVADEEDSCSDEGCGELESVDWTDDEKSLLIRALGMFGKDFTRISQFVTTRSREQCKIFFSKARKCLGLDAIHPGQDTGDTPMRRSDADDACSKIDNTSSEGFVPAGNTPMHSETERLTKHYEVAGRNHEEVECKTNRLTPAPDDGKLVREGENPQSDKSLEEKDAGALKCPGTNQFHEAVEPSDTTSRKTEQLESHAAAEVWVDTGGINPIALKTEEESGLVSRWQTKADKDADIGVSLSFASDSNASRDVLNSHSLGFAPNYHHQIPLEQLSYLQRNPHIQLKQDSPTNLPLKKALPDSSSIHSEHLRHVASQTILNLEDQGNRRHQNLVARDFYHPLIGNLSLNQVRQPLHILRGYPLQVLNHKEAKRDGEMLGISQLNQYLLQDTSSERNSGSRLLSSQSGILHSLNSENQPEAQLQPCSQSSCGETEVQSHRTGDVKLFGQILSHPSSQQKSNSSSQECDSRPLSPIENLTMKPSNGQKDVATASRPGSSDLLGQAELPLRSYGFWDGNRIQTGYSALPESAIMIAKYQGSLAAGVASSNGVLTDYQHAYLQQQGRAVLGVNMVGGGGILVGAGGGTSNPVAALKLHYAGRAKILTSEVESWRGGDVRGK